MDAKQDYTPQLSRNTGPDLATTDDIDIREIIHTLRINKQKIFKLTALVFVLGLLYAIFSTPTYTARATLKIDGGKSSGMAALAAMGGGMLADIAGGAGSDINTEVEIIRSRSILKGSVEANRLQIDANPKYFPIFGRRFFDKDATLAPPSWSNFGGFCWGGEKINVTSFAVPGDRLRKKFTITYLGSGHFKIKDPISAQWFSGTIGKLLTFSNSSFETPGQILIQSISANKGNDFIVRTYQKDEAIDDLQDKINVSAVKKGANIIQVSLDGKDPSKIKDVVNATLTSYLASKDQENFARTQKNINHLLKDFLPALEVKLDRTEKEFAGFRKKNRAAGLLGNIKGLAENMAAAQTSLWQLRQQEEALSANYGPEHPQMLAVRKARAEAEAETQRVYAEIQRADTLTTEAAPYYREVGINSELYVGLRAAIQQLEVSQLTRATTATVIDSAHTYDPKDGARRIKIALASLLFGFLLSMVWVLASQPLRDIFTGEAAS